MKAPSDLPLVSVIIPSFNYARFLDRRIMSVLNQSLSDLEIIILDDNSSDPSAEIIEKYRSNPKVAEIIYNTQNSGSPFSQWFKGIALAKGKYIWIAEADDFATSDFLQKAVEVLEKNPDCNVAFSGSVCVGPGDETLTVDHDRWTEKKQPPKEDSYNIFNGSEYVCRNMFWRCYFYNASGAVWRKEALTPEVMKELQLCIPMRNSGDWLFWTILAATGKVAEIYTRTNRFRLHPDSATVSGTRVGKRMEEDIQVVQYICSRFNLSPLRRFLRHGALRKNINRLPLDRENKEKLKEQLDSLLGRHPGSVIVEKILKPLADFIPLIPSAKNDRL